MKITLQIENKITTIINKIGSQYDYELVPLIVEPFSIALNCYPNVKNKVSKDGGNIHYGWKIHVGEFIIEAERHAVWEDVDENLICITPDKENSKEIIFISQNIEVLDHEQIGNIRINNTGRTIVNDWISICNSIDEAYYHLTQRLDDFKINIPPIVRPIITQLEEIKGYLLGLMKKSKSNNPNCYCENGFLNKKKFSKCHGAIAKKLMREIKTLVNEK